MKKIAIVGSRRYTNKLKIKEFIFKLKEQFGDDVEIVSGGCKYGADKYAKQYALEFNLKYVEFPPAHESHNLYCIKEPWHYKKQYNVGNYFARNKEIAEYAEYVVGFIPKNVESNGTMSTIKHAIKLNKKNIVIS